MLQLLPRRARPGLVAITLLAAACTAEQRALGPYGPPDVPATGPARAAFLFDVDLGRGRVLVAAPRVESPAPGDGGIAFSLVGGDAVLLTTSNFSASAVGAFQPGKVRVSFDVVITSLLAGAALQAPSVFPLAPPGTTGPLLFPYDIAVATTSGGTSSGGGSDVIVVLPGGGLVAPSPDWDGAPWNFFNDSTCLADNDCFRYEEFPPVLPGGTTAARRVGFDIDPTVGQFTARLILAADVTDLAPAPTGGIQGSITSPALGPLAGVTVTLPATGASTLTDALGGFTFTGVPVGTVSVVLGGLPALCTAQSSYSVLVQAGGVTSLPLSLTCGSLPLFGNITGMLADGGGTPLPGVTLTFTPTGGVAAPPVVTGPGGTYLVTGLPVGDGTGTVSLGGLPAACPDPGLLPYSGLVNGGSLQLNLVVGCP
ncbi:MAG: hypothetical protein IPK12_16220 [Gemmatimonadetes bacterium]|nr:hypothetical protein [Gemmatimonadota bacterium]